MSLEDELIGMWEEKTESEKLSSEDFVQAIEVPPTPEEEILIKIVL